MFLLALPDELLIAIARVPVDEAEPHVGSDSFEFPGRRDLLSLVKTNRRLNAIATPLLYHIVSVHSVDPLIELIVTFFLNPRLAAHVRVVNLPIERYLPASSLRSPRAKATLALAGTPPPSSFHEDLCRLVDPAIPWPPGGEGVGPACATLLRQTVNIHTLSIHCLAMRPYGDESGLAKRFRELYGDSQSHFLPRLERLCLAVPLDLEHDPLAPHAFMSPRGGTKHLELSGGTLQITSQPFDPEPWRDLETIRVSNVSTSGAWWYRLCYEARPRLQRLDIHTSLALPPHPDPHHGYNEALGLCAATLERLSLNIGRSLLHAPALGPQGRLSCLSSMERLTHLELSVALLFPSSEAMDKGDICDTLPPSLTWLHLREHDVYRPWRGAGAVCSEDELTRLLQRALLQLVIGSRDRLLRLTEVQLTRRTDKMDSIGPELDAIATLTQEEGDRGRRSFGTTTVSFCPQRVLLVEDWLGLENWATKPAQTLGT